MPTRHKVSSTPGIPSPPPGIDHPGPFRRAAVTRLETPYTHALHAYQGISPWSPQGDRLLYCGFDTIGAQADICVRNTGTGASQRVGSSTAYDFHTAAYQQWTQGGIAFRTRRGDCRGTQLLSGPDCHEAAFVPHMRIRSTSRDGTRGYGHFNDGSGDSAARMGLSTGKVEVLFTAGKAARHLPADLAKHCAFAISHFVPNPAETHAFFKLDKPAPHQPIPNSLPDWGAFFICDLRNRTLRCLGQRISGHPQWMPDNRHTVNIMQPLDGSDNRWIIRQDMHTGQVRRLLDLPIEGAGHPVISPCGRYLATDAYAADGKTCPVYLLELATGRATEIARFTHSTKLSDTYQPHTISRANLHPVWSPCGRQILVNANDGGAQLSMYLLTDFLHQADLSDLARCDEKIE